MNKNKQTKTSIRIKASHIHIQLLLKKWNEARKRNKRDMWIRKKTNTVSVEVTNEEAVLVRVSTAVKRHQDHATLIRKHLIEGG